MDYADKDDDRKYRYFSSQRIYNLISLIASLVFVGFLVWFLADVNPELCEKVITLILAFLGGFGGGYGFKSLKS